jgi:hypothetical protein
MITDEQRLNFILKSKLRPPLYRLSKETNIPIAEMERINSFHLQQHPKTPKALLPFPPMSHLSTFDVAARLGVSPGTVRQWRTKDKKDETRLFPTAKKGNTCYYRTSDVVMYEFDYLPDYADIVS